MAKRPNPTTERVSMVFLRSKAATALAALGCTLLICVACLANASAAQLLVVGSPRCPYCLAWEREIGHTYSTSEAAQKAPLRRLNIEADRPADLSRIGEVHITPTFVLVEEGREVGRIEGYTGSQSFWPRLRKLMARLHQEG